jgi:hypothetical protein
LIDISMDVLTAAGTSTERDGEIENLQGGGHDPKRRGFTLQQAELSVSGAVDPYFTAEAHIVFIPEGVELEEAFFTTTSLPYGLQLEAGHFLTEFGLINPRHPHSWDWIDQPIINTRLMGGDGTRAPGFRLGWLTPLPWFSELHFGMQNADALSPSFFDGDAGGRPGVVDDVRDLGDMLYLARFNNSWNFTDEVTTSLGFSMLHGPNATGRDGETWVYGTDLKVLWRPLNHFRGWPFLLWQSEAIKRDFTADWFIAGAQMASESTGGGICHGGHCHGGGEEEPSGEEVEFPNNLPADILRDAGLYTQILWGFRWGWAAGLRYEFASGSGPSVSDGILVSRQTDPFRDDRHRISPLISYRPTEFSRIRLQYNYDNAEHLSGNSAHSVWVGGEVLWGFHPAHRF